MKIPMAENKVTRITTITARVYGRARAGANAAAIAPVPRIAAAPRVPPSLHRGLAGFRKFCIGCVSPFLKLLSPNEIEVK